MNRIDVWNETKEYYHNYPTWSSYKYTEFPDLNLTTKYESTTITFVKGDMIDKAIELKKNGANPLVLNMADWDVAGGCVDAGSGAQEEECFRRSNYFKTLLQTYYPLKGCDTIVSKGVEYYRHGPQLGYAPMASKVKLDMIAQPALRFPQVTKDNKYFENMSDSLFFEEKIQMLLSVAALQGNDTLILSAWGCGAFGCPPYHVAKKFKDILQDYDGVFREVVFAIIGSNYNLFKDAFEEST